MSHRTARHRIEIGDNPTLKGGVIIATVHAVETAFLKGSVEVCESPLCEVSFPQAGLEIEPKRFCSGKCRQQASLIRRVSRLLENETDERVLEILRGKP
jgi:hypothetical protein